jgi:hypothetical protein
MLASKLRLQSDLARVLQHSPRDPRHVDRPCCCVPHIYNIVVVDQEGVAADSKSASASELRARSSRMFMR